MASSSSVPYSDTFGVPELDPTAWLQKWTKAYKAPDLKDSAFFTPSNAADTTAPSSAADFTQGPDPSGANGPLAKPLPSEDQMDLRRRYWETALDYNFNRKLLEDAVNLSQQQSMRGLYQQMPAQMFAGEFARQRNLAASQDWRAFVEKTPSNIAQIRKLQQEEAALASSSAADRDRAIAMMNESARNFGGIRYGGQTLNVA